MSDTAAAPAGSTATAPVQNVVELRDVHAGYLPGVNILNGANLTAAKGELIGIIGPNGA
ncbi:MAG TPA: ABC transporter ATP-binding protein, partial [Microbacterium sp.]|nr:ABC transporter ATP-binding protein [Microbacterium sp.]